MIKIKSLFISDLHLGNPNSQATKVLTIFKEYDFENLFIVGDFIDMTYMKRKKIHWNKNHLSIIQKILKFSKKKVNVVYIIGNHDNYIRHFLDEDNINIGNILICNEYIYQSVTNEKIYIVHGDQFDGFILIHPFLYWLGDNTYEFAIKINKIYNFFRKMFGYDYWSLSQHLKTKVKNIIQFLSEYEKWSEIKIKEKNCNSILMGHTHSPIIKNKYYNTGDFIENCSYIIEEIDGKMILLFC